MKDYLLRAAKVKLIIFDVDGVLTDGSLILGDDGQEYKAFYARDGHGMKMLQASGVEIGVITGRTSNVVLHRMKNLGVKYIYQGYENKLPAYFELLKALSLKSEDVAYVGDDVVDLPIMQQVGFAIAVQDAHLLVKQHAHWVTPEAGGRGAARAVCELIMDAQKTLEKQLHQYSTSKI